MLVAGALTVVTALAPVFPTAAHAAATSTTRYPIAYDSFTRVTTNGWGKAVLGGAYTLSNAPGDWRANPDKGQMTLPADGSSRRALLPATNALNTEITAEVSTARAPTPAVSILTISRSNGVNEYRARLRLTPQGKALVTGIRRIDTVMTRIGNEVAVPLGGFNAWSRGMLLKSQVTGRSPTTISVKAWPKGTAEPTAWQYQATDNTAVLQQSGSVGMSGLQDVGASSSNTLIFHYFEAIQLNAPTVALGGGPVIPSDTGAYLGASSIPRFGETKLGAIRRHETAIGRKLAIDRQFYRWDTKIITNVQQDDKANGRIPAISFYPALTDGTIITWSSIASGQQDAVLRAKAAELKAYGAPVLFNFNHEPYNESIGGWGTPADYIAAWRHAVNVFRAQNVTNVSWMWILTAWDFQKGRADQFYPGDSYVDWIGANPFNFYARDYPKWQSFEELSRAFYDWGASHRKPLIIGANGTEEDPNSPSRKPQWFRDAAAKMPTWSNIKAYSYYDSTIDGYHWEIDTSLASQQAYKDAIASRPYFAPTL